MVGRVDEDPEEGFRRTVRFVDLAREFGVDLPPFFGPLQAFGPAPTRSGGEPCYLGGDLHAVHPETPDPGGPQERDDSLDLATVSLLDGEGWALDIQATEGVWCTRLKEATLECGTYFSITDSEGRVRTWLILPPAESMIGIAHLWLPRIPPPPDRVGE